MKNINENKLGQFVVRLIGSDKSSSYETETREEAIEKLREEYETVLNNHGDIFDETVFDEGDGEFRIIGEEFAQFGKIRPVNAYTGTSNLIQQISECADDAADFATVYVYELLDMQDVYTLLGKVRELCEKAITELASTNEE